MSGGYFYQDPSSVFEEYIYDLKEIEFNEDRIGVKEFSEETIDNINKIMVHLKLMGEKMKALDDLLSSDHSDEETFNEIMEAIGDDWYEN